MNREQKRNFVKLAKKRGINEQFAKAYIAMKEDEENGDKVFKFSSKRQAVNDGDKVFINVDKIKSTKYFEKMLPEYKEFIEQSSRVMYTAKVEKEHFVSLQENPKWLFWVEDLIIPGKSESN